MTDYKKVLYHSSLTQNENQNMCIYINNASAFLYFSFLGCCMTSSFDASPFAQPIILYSNRNEANITKVVENFIVLISLLTKKYM